MGGGLCFTLQVLRHFPRSERHVLSQEIRQSMWAVLALIERAARARDKIRLLQELDIELALLKQRVRIAHRLGYLPIACRVTIVAPAWPTWPHAGYVVVEDRRVEVRRVSAD